MSTVEVIENLIKIGTIAADAAEKNKKDGKFDYVGFFSSAAPGDIAGAVKTILSSLKTDDLKAAKDSVEKKQKDLLAGKQLYELSTEKIVQYSSLTDTKLALQTAILKRTVEGDFFTWLVDGGGLSSIIKVAKVVVPLLV
jgi:hypothetical protein